MFSELYSEYKKLLKKQKCPACKNRCIGLWKKRNLQNPFCDNRCPVCGYSLKLVGKMHRVGMLVWAFFILYFISAYIMIRMGVYYIPEIVYILVNLFPYNLFQFFVVVPFSKIEKYDSTPMDDLIINTKKLKALIKKIFTKNIN